MIHTKYILGVLHAGTEHAEHIHIIITSVQKSDNTILD